MQVKIEQKPELPEEALGKVLIGKITGASYRKQPDMTALTYEVQFGAGTYRVSRRIWAGRGNTFKRPDEYLRGMCACEGLDYDTYVRELPDRLDLKHKEYCLQMVVRRTESGTYWQEILSHTVRESGKERTREEILEDTTFRLNQQISEMQLNLCILADTQQKADSECRKLRKAYDELAAEYRSVVSERDSLRRRLGLEPSSTMMPENILDISDGLPGGGRSRHGGPPDGDVSDGDILQAFLAGKI